MKKLIFCSLTTSFLFTAGTQENLTYQKPPQEILELLDVLLTQQQLLTAKRA